MNTLKTVKPVFVGIPLQSREGPIGQHITIDNRSIQTPNSYRQTIVIDDR